MSYDLFFRPRSGELSREDLFEYFAGRSGYTFPDDDEDVVAYENEVTGVYFQFRFDQGTGEGEFEEEDDGERDEDDDGESDGPEIAFEINAFRPHVFALEAQVELAALVAKFDLAVSDPQEQGIDGHAWDGAAFVRGWTWLNEHSYATILRDEWDPEEPLHALPRAEIERCWRWNVAYDALVEEHGEQYFIANIAFAAKEGRVLVHAMWPDDRPILLPRIDEVLLVRGEGRQQQTRLVGWDELRERVPALQRAPARGPGEHWAVTEPEIGDRLEAFFRSGTRNARVTLVEPDRIHAIEDVNKARASS